MINSEQSEIVHICDRAYVMREGRVAGHLARHELIGSKHPATGHAS